MALKATIYKAEMQVSDMDRSHYGTHVLTLARHPSETEERLMVRILAFALNAHERLEFGRGISAEGEPDLWRRDDTGAIEEWIEVGLPDERELRKAAGRARSVEVLTYGRGSDLWWEQNRAALARLRNLRVLALSAIDARSLAGLANRNMRLTCTIQEGTVWFGDEADSHALAPRQLQAPAAGRGSVS
jgi:uncharacterized protein YaeQ